MWCQLNPWIHTLPTATTSHVAVSTLFQIKETYNNTHASVKYCAILTRNRNQIRKEGMWKQQGKLNTKSAHTGAHKHCKEILYRNLWQLDRSTSIHNFWHFMKKFTTRAANNRLIHYLLSAQKSRLKSNHCGKLEQFKQLTSLIYLKP